MSQVPDDPRPSAPAAGKPTLEALLRVKRAERPGDAFWSDFDRGFRQKQLAAIIEPRPWWLGLALLGRRLAPLGLPASAGAAALLALVVVRTEAPFVQGPSVVDEADSAPSVALAASTGVSSATALVASSTEPSNIAMELVDDAGGAPAAHPAHSEDQEAPALAATASISPAPAAAVSAASEFRIPVVAALLSLPAASSSGEPTPSEATIAENLATLRAESPTLVAELAPALASADELPASDALAARGLDPRQARLLALAEEPISRGNDLASVRERMVHRLAYDDRAPGSSSRLGVGGDRFSLSF